MIRISTIFSFTLLMGVLFSWGALLKLSFDAYSLSSRGQTAVVLPIDDYETTHEYKKGTKEVQKTYYVANLSARVSSGEVVDIPRKPVTLQHIEESHRKQISIVFLPEDPKTNRFVGEEPQLFRLLLTAIAFSIVSFLWFRRRRA